MNDQFECNIGVRQGEIISPFLFYIFQMILSDQFDCNIGVRQGESISPFLF